jgi:hypothetical protein
MIAAAAAAAGSSKGKGSKAAAQEPAVSALHQVQTLTKQPAKVVNAVNSQDCFHLCQLDDGRNSVVELKG